MWVIQKLIAARLLGATGWPYWFACCCQFSAFLSASSALRVHNVALVENVLPDAIRFLGRPLTWAAAIGAILLLAFGPRSLETPSGGRAFQRWYSRQARLEVPASWQPKPVSLIELVDYQCPVCRQAAHEYNVLIRDFETNHHDSFAFLPIDFPLENECNSSRLGASGGLHPAACEAAAAVRMARSLDASKERAVQDWLWTHQSELSRDIIFDGVKQDFGLDVRSRYFDLLPEIARDAAEGRRLHVTATPTFFLNGRQLPFLPVEAMKTAIQIELNAYGEQGKQE